MMESSITLELLQGYYCVPLVEVAVELGVSLTMLKKICRKHGIQRWPHRQIRSINNLLQELHEKANAPGANLPGLQAQAELLEKKKRLVAKGASSGLQAALRNALFLANPSEIEEDDMANPIKKVMPKLDVKPVSKPRGEKRPQAVVPQPAQPQWILYEPKPQPMAALPPPPQPLQAHSFTPTMGADMDMDMAIAELDAVEFSIDDVPVDDFEHVCANLHLPQIAQQEMYPLPADEFEFDEAMLSSEPVWGTPVQKLPQAMHSGTGYMHQQNGFFAPPSFESVMDFGFQFEPMPQQASFEHYLNYL